MLVDKHSPIHMSVDSHRDDDTLLSLFQLIDSSFPTGSFAHSFGLETYTQYGLVNDRWTFETYLRSVLQHGVRNGDAVAVTLAYKTTDIEYIIDLDTRLTALKTPDESRQGSIKTGKQFLRNANRLFDHEKLDAYRACIQSGKCAGHHAIAYGLVTQSASIDLHTSLLGYLHAYVVGQVSAAIRLIPLGATDGQLVIQAVHPELVEIATLVECAEPGNLGNFTPGLDIRSMQHERLYSRLFVS